MASRNLLHFRKLKAFKEWLLKNGWIIEEPKGEHEVLRARKKDRKHPLVVYNFTVMERDSSTVRAFLKEEAGVHKNNDNKAMTNADRIREMNDEELAEFLEKQVKQHCTDYNCVGTDFCYFHNENGTSCRGAIRSFLKSEVEE